ncbi:pectinesterase family protein [Catenovulum agarivorans]|uniref:pectinesterase family protein n=1 Tax=Catenovulum agarivorans TaxID=1172192 RepID=UPI001ED8D56C|nr:pectinesterase family protein [Catenovulum agarivorans]
MNNNELTELYVVSNESEKNKLVDDGKYAFTEIQQAVNFAPTHGATIYIEPGVYQQRVEINKQNISLIGRDRDNTVIEYGLYAGFIDPEKGKKIGTFGTATFRVTEANFTAKNITIANSFDYPANEKLDKTDSSKVNGEQAVALQISGNADKSLFINVSLLGYQDTLYADSGRSAFIDSKISGHVDFIFGAGTVWFENSEIQSRRRYKDVKYTGYITAPSTRIQTPYGFIFYNCKLTSEEGVTDGSVPLGRPWHPTTTFSDGRYANPYAVGNAVFMRTSMGAHIATEGWSSMGGTAKDGGKKTQFPPETARFFEYQNTGTGAEYDREITPEIRRQLTDFEFEQFYSKSAVLSGWLD